MSFFVAQAVSVCAVLWALWQYIGRLVTKTELDNIPGPASHSFWKGSFGKIYNVNGWDFHREMAEQFGRVVKIHAPFGAKQLYIFDPKAMHHIVVKDEYIFEETTPFIESNRLIFGMGLLSTVGDHHRKQRKMLNPVFATAHLRQMVPVFYDVAHKLRANIAIKLAEGPQEIDTLHWMRRAALELIGRCGFGHSFDSFIEGENTHPYNTSMMELVPTVFTLQFLRTYLLPMLVKIGSPRFRKFVVDLMSLGRVRRIRDIIELSHNTCVHIFEARKLALQKESKEASTQEGHRSDIISILMRANMEASEEDRLSDSEVIGQISTFTFAAMDTTSSALSRILYLLSTRPEVQEKLRKEVTDASQGSEDLSYDELVSLPFLDAVCKETLRLYPPVPFVRRTTRKDVVLPFSTPVKGIDGRDIHNILLPKDTDVMVSALGSNRDPALWGPDSFEWKPERWLSPLPDAVINARIPGVYSHLMTFLGGGRACIGFKFSQLEMKVILSVILPGFHFAPSENDIQWQMSSIVTPALAGSLKTGLPMIFSLVKPLPAISELE